MLNRCLQLMLLTATLVGPLAGCIIVPYHHHRDYEGGPVYAPAPPPGYYRGY